MLDEPSTATTTLALVKDFLNSAHYQRCTEFPWVWMLWPVEVTFSTTSARDYTLHEEFERPLYFRNNTTKTYMQEVPLRGLPEDNRNFNSDTGDADHFFFSGTWPVTTQPASATTVTIVSSSANDTTAGKAITLYGTNSSGHLISEALTPNGTTNVTSSSSFATVTEVVKGTSWVGTMTMTIAGSTVLTLLSTQMGKQYRVMRLIEVPDTAQTLGYRFYRQVRTMSADSDLPLIPASHADVLVWDALVQMASYLVDANPQSVELWRARQQAAEKALYLAYANEGQSLEARPHYVRYMDATYDDPRFQ